MTWFDALALACAIAAACFLAFALVAGERLP